MMGEDRPGGDHWISNQVGLGSEVKQVSVRSQVKQDREVRGQRSVSLTESVRRWGKRRLEGNTHSLDTKSGQCHVTGQAGQYEVRGQGSGVSLTGSARKWERTGLEGSSHS